MKTKSNDTRMRKPVRIKVTQRDVTHRRGDAGWVAHLRQYSEAKLRTPEGSQRVPRTLVMMADGTNPPCTK